MNTFPILNVLTIVTLCVLGQVNEAHSFFPFPQDPAPPPSTPPNQRVGNGGFNIQGNFNLANLANQGKVALGNMALKGKSFMENVRNQLTQVQDNVLLIQAHTPKTFYEQCGKSVRHCYLTQRIQAVPEQPHSEDVEPSMNKVELEQSCISTKHVCVGNIVDCVQDGSCDVAMKITETILEGKTKWPGIQVSYINNCQLGGQSITDAAKTPQMYFGIGFTTYNAAGDAIECRRPSATDFKLVFLWKNSTVDDSNGPRICQKAHEDDFFSVTTIEPTISSAASVWPATCNLMNLAKESTFNFKSFITENVPISHYTSFFSPPYDFADSFEPQYSSNNMVITGSIPE